MKRIPVFCLPLLLAAMMTLFWGCQETRPPTPMISAQTNTIASRLTQFGPVARARLSPYFQRAGVAYPPRRLVFVGLKAERLLQIYAPGPGKTWRLVRAYPIFGASGGPGPKLREGDRQVPEGIYPIEMLNPNSRHHVSMRIGYPNAADRAQAAKEGRTNLGGDIMIHGGHGSIGCLAVGDEASEDLFVLAADTGIENISVILSPVDFRTGAVLPPTVCVPAWMGPIYAEIKARLAAFPLEKRK